MEAINFFKKVICVAHLQTHHFGNMCGTLKVALERVLKKKNKRNLLLKNLIITFKTCGAKKTSFFFRKKMNPGKMFEPDNDWNLTCDFDKITLREKKEFIELVFARQRALVEILYSGQMQHRDPSKYEKVYREQRYNIIFGLNGKLDFYKVSCYFASFFKKLFRKKWLMIP